MKKLLITLLVVVVGIFLFFKLIGVAIKLAILAAIIWAIIQIINKFSSKPTVEGASANTLQRPMPPMNALGRGTETVDTASVDADLDALKRKMEGGSQS